jgi:outer membrane protein OmpA-like peptidoglycan-associated protein
VVTYLIAAGVPASRLKFKGYGSSQPAAPNDTEANRALNRRIEMVVLKLK